MIEFSLVDRAYQISPISRQAIEQAQVYTQKIMADHAYLLKENASLWTNNQYADMASLQTSVLNRIDRDLAYIENLNQAISNYSEPGENGLTWSLATNFMTLILNGAKHILQNDENLSHLLNGQSPFPNGYDNAYSNIPVSFDQNGLFGNSNLTYLSTAILNVHLELLGKNSHLQDISLKNTSIPWIDQAAIAHVTPIPEEVTSTLIQFDPSFTEQFSYFYTDDKTPQGFAFVHSGYAFGGQRGEYRYEPLGKLYGPEDCSSWIAKLSNSDVLFSTIDMLYAYRMAQPESERGYIEENWLNTDYAKVMNYLTPVTIHDPIKDIHPGLVWASRTFEEGIDHQLSPGIAGHVTLVLGLQEDGDVLTLGYRRMMPDAEAFGLESFPTSSSSDKEIMFFTINSPALSVQDVLQNDFVLPFETNSSEPYLTPNLTITPTLMEEHVLL